MSLPSIPFNHSKHFSRFLYLIVIIFTSDFVFAFPLPDKKIAFPVYESIATPFIHSDPQLAKPVAIGSAAAGGKAISLQVRLDSIDSEADLYFGISVPSLAQGQLFLVNEMGKFIDAKEDLVPWKKSVTSVNESLLGSIPLSQLAEGDYIFYLLLTEKGQTHPMDGNYFLWSSVFKLVKDTVPYVAPGPYGSYPASQNSIQGWIDALDNASIRAHSWDIWGSITADSGVDDLPVWETWFTGYEIFELEPESEAPRRDFERPRQFHHAQILAGLDIPVDLPESLTSFNRYTKSLADYIVDHRYNELDTLKAINDQFNAEGTAVEERQILTSNGPVDASQVVLKPVFQFISSSEPTAIPYWAGVAPSYTTNLSNPEPKTWRQGVVVDPTGKLQPGTMVTMSVNQEPPKPLPVVSLDDFYYIVLTEAEAEAFLDDSFGFGSGDDVGDDNDTSEEALKDLVKEGNIALLMAMHVTTKEITNWTWQTFWWAGNPQDVLYGIDRPSSIPAPWNHYNMRTAYYMVSPANTIGGDPLISFNPYLETNLQGTVPGPNGTEISWTGVHTNCMSCHRMAGYKTQGYQPNGLILPGDSALFGEGTKTDFLWSIPIRAFSSTKE